MSGIQYVLALAWSLCKFLKHLDTLSEYGDIIAVFAISHIGA